MISAVFHHEDGEKWELRTQAGEPFPISILSPGDEVHPDGGHRHRLLRPRSPFLEG